MDRRALGGLALATLGLWIGCGLDSNGTGVFETTTSAGGGPTTSSSTSSSTSTGMGGEGPGGMGGMGGAGGAGGTGGNGGSGGAPTPTSCPDVFSGVITLDPDGDGPAMLLDVYCEQGWALVHNSVKYTGGGSGGAGGGGETTLEFWNIPYSDALLVKGDPMSGTAANYYDGRLYLHGRTYREDFEDTLGVIAEITRATVMGINEANMHFVQPMLVSGNNDVFQAHFNAGWSAMGMGSDFDTDMSQNCAETYFNVTQHYGGCWKYNLGTTNVGTDEGWGPHADATVMPAGLAVDPPAFSRLNRISRWTQW
jgi:hypothetical protein